MYTLGRSYCNVPPGFKKTSVWSVGFTFRPLSELQSWSGGSDEITRVPVKMAIRLSSH